MGGPTSQLVFELSDLMRLSAWWSKQHGRLLEWAIDENYDTPAVLERGK